MPKKKHFIVVGEDLEKPRLSVHDDQLQLCFPDKDIHSMDGNQVILLLLTNKFNINYKISSMYVTRLALVLDEN